MTAAALDGLKVVDLSQGIAGAYCTKLLAGFGSEVVKVEPARTGDSLRSVGPFHRDESGTETSIPFHWFNTGKKSVTLDLGRPEGVEMVKRLVAAADVVVESFSPGLMAELGLGWDTLHDASPRLILTSISPFGQDGPYRDWQAEEIQIEALAGMMHATGDALGPPLGAGPAICQYSGGLHAYTGTLMALFERVRSGQGTHVDVALLDAGLENVEIGFSSFLQLGRRGGRGPNPMVPWGLYEASDGWAAILAMPQRHWHRAREIFDDERLFAENYRQMIDRMVHRQEYEALLQPCVKTRTRAELFEEGQARHLAFGYLASLEEATELPQHQARGFFEPIEHPVVGTHRQCGAPFKMSETPWRVARAPLLGEHNGSVYRERLGYDVGELERLRAEGVI